MKHIFLINPAAGKRDAAAELTATARALARRRGLDVDIILTRRPGHASDAARTAAAAGGEIRFYACGGDGTAGEVANGIIGCPNAAMTCIPTGTGNDFLKNFGESAALFSDPENLFDGPQFPLDAIDCNGRCALTIACSGFDAQVAADVHKYSNYPVLKGMGSYIASLAVNFVFKGLNHHWRVSLDGVSKEGGFVLAAVCNGRYYGGGFMPMAEARMDDGILNVLIVPQVTRTTFLRFVGPYSKGEYFKFPQVVQGCTAQELILESDEEDIITCLDGEIVLNRRAVFKMAEGKVNFFGPKGCDPNATCRPLPSSASVFTLKK